MKKIIQQLINKFGYQIKKRDSGFSFHPNLDWVKKMDIKYIFDIGANDGQFASFINNIIPSAIIYSFEPIPSCVVNLNLLSNKLKILKVYDFALGDKNDSILFNLNDFSPSSSIMEIKEDHIVNFPKTNRTNKINIKIKKLDDVVPDLELNGNVLVKIDVQGFEEKVLKGGDHFFSQSVSIVIIETSIKELYENEASFDAIYHFMCARGFKYNGNLHQLYSPIDGEILQVDAVFVKSSI